jgi:hypothetical protein
VLASPLQPGREVLAQHGRPVLNPLGTPFKVHMVYSSSSQALHSIKFGVVLMHTISGMESHADFVIVLSAVVARDLHSHRMRPSVRTELKRMNLVGSCSAPCLKHATLVLRIRGADLSQPVESLSHAIDSCVEWKVCVHETCRRLERHAFNENTDELLALSQYCRPANYEIV